jgi:hypothetical protein
MTFSARDEAPDRSAGVANGSLHEERLVEDIILLHDVLAACASGNERWLMDLGVLGRAS